MAVSAARAAAFEILLRVEREGAYASELLHSTALSELPSRDHGLATELVMGVLRWQSLLDSHIAAASSQKLEKLDTEVLTALRLGTYQLKFLSRVPARAAIFESVELVKAARKRSADGFVNAVLRKIAASGEVDAASDIAQSSDAETLARNAAHPRWLVARWIEQYGLEAARKICAHDQTVPETSIYLHDERGERELIEAGIKLEPGHFLSSARRVSAGDVAATRINQEGRVSIQDEASQLVARLMDRTKESDEVASRFVLDCCAAPGSKTGLLARRAPRATVVATELHPHRARLLKGLCRLQNVLVVAADARHLPFAMPFERILADVPCSGTGTLARNPEIKWRLTNDDLIDLQKRQVSILKSALAQLAVGGRFVYSTCSMEHEENEDVVKSALTEMKGFRVVDLKPVLEELFRSGEVVWKDIASLMAGRYMRTVPGVHRCDGFFAAMVERE